MLLKTRLIQLLRKKSEETIFLSTPDNRASEPKQEIKHTKKHAMLVAGHSVGHVQCGACELSRLAAMDSDLSPEMLFSVAAIIWLGTRVKIGPRTRLDYKRYIKSLNTFFNLTPLREIHIGHVRKYQKERSETAGAIVVNKEIGTLLQIRGAAMNLRRKRRNARVADELEECYEPLPLPYATEPKTITDEQEQAFLMALRSKPEWEMVYCYAILALNTGARGCEIRALKIGDVNIPAEEIIIRTALKNKWAHRPVPLVASALWAGKRLLELAAEKGSVAPHHCLFPIRLRIGVWDNDRPMTYSGMKKPWTEAREIAGVPDFVPRGSRNQAATRLSESGCDEHTAMQIMGWNNPKMWARYSTPRKAHRMGVMTAAFGAKRAASA